MVVPEVFIVVYKREEKTNAYLTLDEVDAREEFEFRQQHSQATILYSNKDGGELDEVERSTEQIERGKKKVVECKNHHAMQYRDRLVVERYFVNPFNTQIMTDKSCDGCE